MKDLRIIAIGARDAHNLVERYTVNEDHAAPVVYQTPGQRLDAISSSWLNDRLFPAQWRTLGLSTSDRLVHAVQK
jgi:hypothetical protein